MYVFPKWSCPKEKLTFQADMSAKAFCPPPPCLRGHMSKYESFFFMHKSASFFWTAHLSWKKIIINLCVWFWQYQQSKTNKCRESQHQKHKNTIFPAFLLSQKQNSWLPSVHSIFSSSRLYIFFVGTFCNILKNQLYLAGHKKISVLVVGALKVGRYKTQLNPYVKKKNHPKKNLQKIRKTIIGYPPP